MAKTASTMVALGTQAPDFNLPDVRTGETVTLAHFQGKKALLVMFISQHCPFVKHIEHELARLGHDYVPKNVGIVAICSNDVEMYPEDAPSKLKAMAEALDFPFPYCYDESQAVARAYDGACTPDFFLFDGSNKLVYRGQLDDSRPGSTVPVTGADLRQAIDAVLADQSVNAIQKPSIGCNIKWKSR